MRRRPHWAAARPAARAGAPAPRTSSSRTTPRSTLRAGVVSRALGLRAVVAFAVNRRHLRAHRPQVGRELPAMMDGMNLRRVQIEDRRKLEEPAEVGDPQQLVGPQRRNEIDVLRKRFRIPARDVRRGLQFRGHRRAREIERAVDDRLQEPVLGGDDVPGQLEGALDDRLRPVVALVDRNGFDDLPRDRMLPLERTDRDAAVEERLFWLQCGHDPNCTHTRMTWTIAPQDGGVRLDKYLAAPDRAGSPAPRGA